MRVFWVFTLLAALSGCSTAYYNTMEKLGIHKRDILVDRVEDARDSQKDAQKQFKSALEQFKSVVVVDGGNIEKVYERLNSEFEESQAAADEIRERIDSIDSVSKALFKEWESELKDYSNKSLRRDSEKQLRETQQRYQQLYGAMQKAESRLQPVLTAMNDQVLYLKHNLNARAIQALKEETVKIDKDVDNLLAAMQQAIAEADEFIRAMRES